MSSKRKRSKRDKAAAKKIRIASVDIKTEPTESYKSKATLLSLVDDCFSPIFNRLSLSDLCSIGQTCKRLQQVSGEYFVRRNGSKVLTIENVSQTGRLIKGPKGERYVNIFTASLRNVILGRELALKTMLERLARFYATNEMAPIKSLRFEGWTKGVMEDYGGAIADMVTEVESFTLSNSNVVGDLHECILKYLPEMKWFTLWKKEKINAEMSYQWLENQYPNLQYFAWHTDDDLPIDLIGFFFRMNPGISFFSLQARSQFTLRQLADRDIRVNELFFTVTGNPKIFTDLEHLCVKQGTRLHLKFPDGDARAVLAQNMAQFIQLAQYIDGLYFENHGIADTLARTLTTFDNLKILQLNILASAHILSNLPTLQEIYAYWSVTAQTFDGYRAAMMLYASRLPNLKRIYMRNNSQKFQKFKFNEFDAARKRLVGACKLKIHVRTDELSYMGALNDIQREYDTIQIERVESEEVKNPLVTEFLIENKKKESACGEITW